MSKDCKDQLQRTVTIPLDEYEKMKELVERLGKFRKEIADAKVAVIELDNYSDRHLFLHHNFTQSMDEVSTIKFPLNVKGYKDSKELADEINKKIEDAKAEVRRFIDDAYNKNERLEWKISHLEEQLNQAERELKEGGEHYNRTVTRLMEAEQKLKDYKQKIRSRRRFFGIRF